MVGAAGDITLAYWEFSNRIITPTVERLVNNPAKAHAVEIGFGDGRLLCAASSFFGRVTGVGLDVGDNESGAREVLESCSDESAEFSSLSGDHKLSFTDSSVHFVYSRYGIARLPDLTTFEAMVKEISRVLVPGGVAMLWFGRMSRMPFAPLNENWWSGWTRKPLNSVNGEDRLHLRMFHARRAVMRAGMKAVALSTPAHPDTSWRLFRGGDISYVTAWKPDS